LRSEVAGSRIRTWHLMPTDRMGPPPGASPPMRMTASWSGSTDPTAYKSVARKMCPNGELPSDSQQTDLQVPTRHRGMRKARLAVHHRSACSGVKALRNTSPLGGRPLLPFRSLDPFRPLREPDRRRRNEERLSRSEQRTGNKPKIRLDRKSPIQVRIRFPPAASQRRTCNPDADAWVANFFPGGSTRRAGVRSPSGPACCAILSALPKKSYGPIDPKN